MDQDKLFDTVLLDLLENPRGGHLSEILPAYGFHLDDHEREKLYQALRAEGLVEETKRIISGDRRIVLTAQGNRIARMNGGWLGYSRSQQQQTTSPSPQGHPRREAGRETVARIRDWDQGHTASERMMTRLLPSAGYQNLEPSRPAGGPDGRKDALCTKEGQKYVAHAWFALAGRPFSAVKKKFLHDAEGITINRANGLVFFTNQNLSEAWQQKLRDLLPLDTLVDFFPIERMAALLDLPGNYGTRREFLQIAMHPEEELASRHVTGASSTPQQRTDQVAIAEPSLEGLDEGVLMYEPLQRCESCSFRFKVKVLGAEPRDTAMDDSNEMDSYYSSTYFRTVTVTCPKCHSLEDLQVFQRFSMPRAGVSIFT